MTNPFEIFDRRLSNIESLLLSIKHKDADPLEQSLSPEQKFSIKELAAYLKCTKATIHSYKRRKVFPYYQTGRTVYFKKSEIDSALEVSKKIGVKAKEKSSIKPSPKKALFQH